jgi:uncharacterized membrane protein YeaQ/YmgE (transglycosylase-associated protein family)
VIFQPKVARPRAEVVRAGWNDAAWDRPCRQIEPAMAPWYERGYAGGLIFREKQQADLLQPARCMEAIAAPRASGLSRTPGTQVTCTHPVRRRQGFGEERNSLLMGMGIFTWIVMGLVASWLASQFMRSGYGRIGETVLDFVGAIVDGSSVVRCWGAIWRRASNWRALLLPCSGQSC